MAGRVQQDSFMDDSDECCPLCVEEFDLSDRSFKPCPCGYQVCQFCYNNIKTNMNGLCPACRRPYDDKNIQWKVISPEEAKADVAAQARKKAAARQKEAERRQVETQNRKHLSGLRVLQKNLVYVVGMNIPGSGEDVLETLRGPNHFGQYGPIIKVVVSKTKEGQPLGIYVTFVNKEDAASCIGALDGVPHDGRTLRAQYGTTKYCSAFLRNETCNNRNCMFLHETGEDSESFSRQDLSSFNALSSQRSAPANRQEIPRPPVAVQQQAQVPNLSSSAQINNHKSEVMNGSDSGDSSALPTSASWAKNPQLEQSKKTGTQTSRSTPSPKTSQAKTALSRSHSRATRRTSSASGPKETSSSSKPESTQTKPLSPPLAEPPKDALIVRLEEEMIRFSESSFDWSLDRRLYDETALRVIDNCPLLVDPNAGARRFALRLQHGRDRTANKDLSKELATSADDEDALLSGSLQLGGEPDTGEEVEESRSRGSYGAQANTASSFVNQNVLHNDFSMLGGRSLTPQQQQNISLLKSGNSGGVSSFEQFHRPTGNSSQHQSQLSNPFQSQNQQLGGISRHGRQSSRYTFSNDAGTASASVKPTATTQILMQQSPNAIAGVQAKSFGSQPPAQPGLYTNTYSNIQGPPPGLKSAGTPPISGGGMFGQGHGFTSGIGSLNNFSAGLGSSKSNNEEMMRDIIRSRGAGGGTEIGKLDLSDPSILQARMHHSGIANTGYGTQGQVPDESDLSQTNPALATSGSLDNQTTTPDDGKMLISPPGLSDFPPLSASKLRLIDDDDRKSTAASSQTLTAVTPKKSRHASGLLKEDLAAQSFDNDMVVVATRSSAARQKPSKLDIGTAQNDSRHKTSNAWQPAEPSKRRESAKETTPASSPKRPITPATAASHPTASPVVRQPRTLRLVQTSKVDPASSADGTSDSANNMSSRQHSRERTQSISTHHGTPAPELISEHASVRSASISRPASPYPDNKTTAVVGQAKARTPKKKERQAKSKVDEDSKQAGNVQAAVAEDARLEEAVQAPIVGRKKKAKKSKQQTSGRSTLEVLSAQPETPDPEPAAVSETLPISPSPKLDESAAEEAKVVVSNEEKQSSEPSPTLRDMTNPSTILTYLRKQNLLDTELFDAFTRPENLHQKFDGAAGTEILEGWDFRLGPAQRRALQRNEPVLVRITEQEHAVVLPDASVCRYLTYDEALKYLRLRKDISETDPSFLTNAALPTCGQMDSSWREMNNVASVGGYESPLPGAQELEQAPEVAGMEGTNDLSGFYGGRARMDVNEFAARLEAMDREDAEDALRASEELMNRARKAVEAEEKRFNAILKRNRKLVRDPS